jgi:hypothetical protein
VKSMFLGFFLIISLSLGFLSQSSSAKSYTTSFLLTENPISEGGNWINGKAVGLDWANVQTTPGLAFGTETGSGGYDDSTALLTGSWGADQHVKATIVPIPKR